MEQSVKTAPYIQYVLMALQGGMDIKTLSTMLGHVSAVTTLDIYTHITGDMQRQAAEISAACLDTLCNVYYRSRNWALISSPS